MKNQHRISRFFEHLFSCPWTVKHYFCSTGLAIIEQTIAASEANHTGQIRLVVETGLDINEILFNKTPRKRAIELFSHLHIWDTEHNNGVLIYLLLADHDVEIVADRGINLHVGHARWQQICHGMEAKFRQGAFEGGVLHGIVEIGAELETYFPSNGQKSKNELPNKPLIL